jgi:hypothetical protein
MSVIKSSTKMQFSNFVLQCLFKDIDKGFQNTINDLVMENCSLLKKESTAGFVFDGRNYVHSESVADNLEQQRLQRYQLDVLHPDLIDEVMELIKTMSHKDMDYMRFKGMINGLLSVVRTLQDFREVFGDMFAKEVKLFNLKYNTKLGKPIYVRESDAFKTLPKADMLYVTKIKEQFEVQYNRYRFLTEILGI